MDSSKWIIWNPNERKYDLYLTISTLLHEPLVFEHFLPFNWDNYFQNESFNFLKIAPGKNDCK